MGEFDIRTDIRVALPEDFQELFRVCVFLHKENGQHEFSEYKARHFIWKGCNRDNSIIFVIGPPTDIKAVLYLEVQQIYYSDESQLGEAFLYVREDHRKSDFAKRLIRHAKRCSEETSLDLTMGVISDHRLAAKKRLYDREFTEGGNGVFYIYRPKSRGERHGFNTGPEVAVAAAGG
jgi:GNAT superfamily N-acetyltransferase